MMIRHDVLERMWLEAESGTDASGTAGMRLVYPQLPFRVYIGAGGSPPRRLLCIDIPENGRTQLEAIRPSKGFTLNTGEPLVTHAGHTGCRLQAADHALNDVFSVMAEDVLDEMSRCTGEDGALEALGSRIGKWQDLFSTAGHRGPTQEEVQGLIGEMEFLRALAAAGIADAPGLWTGPLARAHDFRVTNVAAEIKTSLGVKQTVRIASEEQLDADGLEALYLVAYDIRRDDEHGLTLQEFIAAAEAELDDARRRHLRAKLGCLGYRHDDPHWNGCRYSITQCRAFAVREGFPCLRRTELPRGVSHVSYRLALSGCADFAAEAENVIEAMREDERATT